MRLPNAENAYIPASKLTDYLLSETHPIGRAKAQLLLAAGFDRNNVNILEQGLIAIAHIEEVREVTPSAYGTKYVIDGSLRSPNGSLVQLRTVWIIDRNHSDPRFITAYPARSGGPI